MLTNKFRIVCCILIVACVCAGCGRTESNMTQQTNADGGTDIIVWTEEDVGEYILEQLPWPTAWGGASYGIRTPEGSLILIDGGFAEEDGERVRTYVKENGGEVDYWFITHPHLDHIGAFLHLSSAEDINIKRVLYSPFTDEFMENTEIGRAETKSGVAPYYEFNKEAQMMTDTEFIPLKEGDSLSVEDLRITCIYSFIAQFEDINTNSLVLNISVGNMKAMLTGDITDLTLQYMLQRYGSENDEIWNVDFLQIPHHGYMAGISEDTLYRMTDPSYALLDCTEKEYTDNAVQIQDHVKMVESLGIGILKRFEGGNRIIIKPR